ncbi:carbohydrate esterase family 4 protein [Athelia psychrophila]|uniref:chitin deacetylase n=1 Tax=Athelia psychrophila TaxID=1759441 RepID=A0A166H6L8_9AGAM|nr:carbohydrate esterase family 4 protein [Fibularhizoctonia sp. CBS 109695]
MVNAHSSHSTHLSHPRGLDRTTEAQEATITDATTECSPYTYEPVAQATKLFPENWAIATIIDAEAQAAYNAILPKIPTNIAPKGTPDNSEDGVNYPDSDPDCWWTWSMCTTPKLKGLPADIVNVPEPNTLGYGFDDGPDCAHNVFYNYLTSVNQKATMFYIGSNVQVYPLEAQRAVTDGHEICVHTWSHQYSTGLKSEQIFAELWYTRKMIKLATGVTPTCWRPPYGDVDDRVRAIATALNLTTIVWTWDSNDWSFGSDASVTTQQIDANYNNLISAAKAGNFSTQGTIILTHELTNFTMSEAIKYHPLLAAEFTMVPVGVAYNVTQPYIETNYTLPSFAEYVSGDTATNGSTSTSSSATGTPTASSGTSGTATHSSTTASSSSTGTGEFVKSSAMMHVPAAGAFVAVLAAVGGALCAMA